MKKNLNSGQSLFELVMSIGISAIIIVVLVSLVNNALQGATFSRNQTQAARYAEAATEWLRTERDNNISVFLSNSTSVPLSWCLKDVPLTSGSWNMHNACGTNDFVTGSNLFRRQVDFSVNLNGGGVGKTIITATVSVSWTDSKGTHKVTSATSFTDWRQR